MVCLAHEVGLRPLLKHLLRLGALADLLGHCEVVLEDRELLRYAHLSRHSWHREHLVLSSRLHLLTDELLHVVEGLARMHLLLGQLLSRCREVELRLSLDPKLGL